MTFNMNALSILINGSLFMAPPDKLNDPFEGEFILNGLNEMPNELYLKNHNFPLDIDFDDLKSRLKDRLKKHIHEDFGVTCFSKKKDNLLMWSHYADAHKGICIVFDAEKLVKSINSNYIEAKLEPITYSKKFPVIDIKPSDTSNVYIRRENAFLFKLNQWKYENEVRLHYKIPENFKTRNIVFDYNAIVGIIEGEKFTKEHKTLLANILKSNSNLSHIKWYKAKSNLLTKKMKIEHFGGYFIPRKITITKTEN
jgi:hypothetical protein